MIYRNGYEPRTVKTTGGPIELERPRVRNAAALGFESQVLDDQGVARAKSRRPVTRGRRGGFAGRGAGRSGVWRANGW